MDQGWPLFKHSKGVFHFLRSLDLFFSFFYILIIKKWKLAIEIKILFKLRSFLSKILFSKNDVKIKFGIRVKNIQSIQLYSGPRNRFYVLEHSHRPTASMVVNCYKFIEITFLTRFLTDALLSLFFTQLLQLKIFHSNVKSPEPESY